MKPVFRIFAGSAILGSILLMSSCGAENTDLTISLSPDQTFLLPGEVSFDSTSLCYDESTINEPRFRIEQLKTTWNGEGTFQPVLVKMEITGNGNVASYTCAISGGSSSANQSIGDFLGYGGETLASGAGEKTSICPIHCGDVSITSTDVDFSVSSTVTLIGIQTNGDGDQVPRSTSTTLSLRNVIF